METLLTAEISAGAARRNLALLRERVGLGVKICAVVKADAYGHGLTALLDVLAEQADAFAVATACEAVELRRLGCRRPILMFLPAWLGPEADEALAELLRQEVTLTVVDGAEVAPVAAAARRLGRPASVHVKIDTGMGRRGVRAEQAPALIERIRREPALRLAGLYTHFATADEADKAEALAQLERFIGVVARSGGREGLTLHAANSAAAIDLPATHLDMVRPGIALYGCRPSEHVARPLPLRPVLRLTAPLIERKVLRAGERCGYGLTYTFQRDTPVGIVPVGYADGYPRSLSNRATMRIAGRDVPVRGRVSMDQTILDLTAAADAAVGDEVEIISPDPDAPHSVESLARLCGTIPYELLTRLGRRARRVRVD